MKVIVAPDSFKGSLTAVEAAQAMAAGISDADPSIETVMLPAADGGEGTMSSLVRRDWWEKSYPSLYKIRLAEKSRRAMAFLGMKKHVSLKLQKHLD